jgi:hypothetical protein
VVSGTVPRSVEFAEMAVFQVFEYLFLPFLLFHLSI